VLDLLGTEARFLLGGIVMMEDGKFEKVRFQFSNISINNINTSHFNLKVFYIKHHIAFVEKLTH